MNKRQLEVQKVHVSEEEKVIRELKQVYNQARKDCEAKIRELSTRTDMENLQSIVYQKQYQEALKQQIDGILDTLNSNTFTTIADYLGVSYENGFIGTLYDLQGQGIPLIFPINQEEVVQALQVDSKLSEGLYKRLGEDTAYLKKSIRAELSRGASNGESWNQIAVHIARGMNSPFNKAYNNSIRIARTEGHRVQQESALHCQQRAKSKGADIMKQWDSTLDGRTRPEHREADGQLREIEEFFIVGGEKLQAPGVGGSARNVCNCRCCLLQRARWAISAEEFYDKWDGDKNELVKIQAKTYNEFKEKAKAVQKRQTSVVTCNNYRHLEKYLSGTYKVVLDSSVKTLDFKSVREGIQGIEKVFDEFPQAKSMFKKISTGNTGVMSATFDGQINFNPKYYKTRQNAVAGSQSTGFHPKGSNIISTGSHEAGHLLEAALINKKIADVALTGWVHWANCTQAKAVVSQACKDAKKLPDGKGQRNAELKSSISRYAGEDDSECLAEAVADYILNGEESAVLSRCIWSILKKELG